MSEQGIQSNRTRILAECAMLLAVASVLSFWPKLEFLPYGGSITIGSMLPIVLISYRRGLGWGFLSAFAFSLIQMLTFKSAGGMSVYMTIGIIFLDYLFAYSILGIGGLFKGKWKSHRTALIAGTLLALSLRFASHVISGFLFFGEYADWFFGEVGEFGTNVLSTYSGNGLFLIYSLIYNATYMIPEIIITVVLCYLISMKSDLLVSSQ